MGNMHRIIWFDQEIRARKYPNTKKIAEHFEISVRQANRDIDYLKDTLRAPLRYIAKMRGYDYENHSYILPNVYMSHEEKRVLSYLAYRYSSFDNTPGNNQVAGLFGRLTGSMQPVAKVPVFNLHHDAVNLITSIQEAINQCFMVQITYSNEAHSRKQMILCPYRLFRRSEVDYLVAKQQDNETVVLLRLDRIGDFSTLYGQTFTRKELNTTRYCSEYLHKPFVAEVEFSSRIFFSEGNVIARQKEGYIYEIEFYDTEDFIGRLLAMASFKKVHRPRWLIQKIKNKCLNVLEEIKQDEQ